MAAKPITTKVAKPETLKAPEPTFESVSAELAAADLKARSLSADAGQAKAARSEKAIGTIRAALNEKIAGDDVRARLLASGVLKGTVSKIVTVLTSIRGGMFSIDDVKSLNGAYNLSKSVTAGAAGAAGATPAPAPATTPEEALKIIIHAIKAEKDPDKALTLGGEWITRITNAITDALKDTDDEEGEE